MPSRDDHLEPADITRATNRRVVGGKYRLGRLLGEGGMGSVYEAEHLELGVLVAVKLVNLGVDADPRTLARFRREARATAAIKHENIVQVTDAGADELGPFIVMERLEGESLSSLLQRERVLDCRQAIAITRQIVSGLIAAHDNVVVHRDLKPANVLLCELEGGVTRVKLLDFGISKFLNEEAPSVTTTGDVIGTPRFMSPEQVRGQLDVDGRADLYGVGAMLYVMVTGRFPHTGSTREEVFTQILTGDIVPPRVVRPDVPEALERIILKLLSHDREARYANGRELLAALKDATPPPSVEELAVTATSPPPVQAIAPSPPVRSRRPIALAVAAGLLAAAAVGGWAVSRQPSAAAATTPLRLGITRYTADANIRKELQPLTTYLARKLGREVQLVIVDYGVDHGAKLMNGDLDVGALSPYVYVRTKTRAPGIRILATPVGASGGASYEGVVVARAGTGIARLEDLRGKVFCYVEESSASGYLYPRALFRRRGLEPDRTFSGVRFKGTHSDTLAALAAGECDGAAVTAMILEESARFGLARDQFVTLEATPRIPFDAYCVSDRLPRDVAEKIEAALLELAPGSDEAKAVFAKGNSFSGFTRASDGDYDRVRAMATYLDEPAAR